MLQAVVERQFCATGAQSGLLEASLCCGQPTASRPWGPPQDLPRTGPFAIEVVLVPPRRYGSFLPPWCFPGEGDLCLSAHIAPVPVQKKNLVPPWCLASCPIDPFLPPWCLASSPMSPFLPPWCLSGCPNDPFLPPWCLPVKANPVLRAAF